MGFLGGNFSNRVSLLASKTDWAAGDFASSANRFYGPDGNGGLVMNATATSVDLFDVTPYSQVILVWVGTFANAETLEVHQAVYSDFSKASAVKLGDIYATTAASGGPVTVQSGCGAVETSTGAPFTGVHTFSLARPNYLRIQTFNSGATGTVTAGRMFLYGVNY